MRTFLKKYLRKKREAKAHKLIRKHQPYFDAYDRVYHVHIRKSAGTSINAAFWGLSGFSLANVKREPILVKSPYVFVRNHLTLIEKGDYFYANSHMPFWRLNLPKNTFTFCVLRDPFSRLVSLYKYLKYVSELDPKIAKAKEPAYKPLQYQLKWVGNGFSDFLDLIPEKHLQHQLYMFSEKMEVPVAMENIGRLNRIYFQEHFDAAIDDLSKTLKLPLSVLRERSFTNIPISISKEEEKRARLRLEKEYVFYDKVLEKIDASGQIASV
ncbi:MAG TPA: sulfotransferase family 2 domain-containing protein [Flavobacteriaceae bacterium]|nr:sulfotransferase family 2 domain-containing protein [Flavobacteriaceae bacterium]HPF12436.1 sulfotransferase family 2 domain-containing protein [Flavobacteriaceae bacterium]HQU21619.1 sulfotransferase family 2 domain-containing protein [Flavobacteriaceae bacterium]HQU66194.1 sulfotransferase family 2 domain-containing protein [Flavobacteriaceae bacterium]